VVRQQNHRLCLSLPGNLKEVLMISPRLKVLLSAPTLKRLHLTHRSSLISKKMTEARVQRN
jgi:hypothetical protein